MRSNKAVDNGAILGLLIPGLPFDQAERHGDNNNLSLAMVIMKRMWKTLTDWAPTRGSVCDQSCEWFMNMLKLFGEYLHTVQDLYAHSDYVELHGGVDPTGKAKLPGFEHARPKVGEIPLWNMDPSDEANYKPYFSGHYNRGETFEMFIATNYNLHLYTAKDNENYPRGKMTRNRSDLVNNPTNFMLASDLAQRHTEAAWKAWRLSMAVQDKCIWERLNECCAEWAWEVDHISG